MVTDKKCRGGNAEESHGVTQHTPEPFHHRNGCHDGEHLLLESPELISNTDDRTVGP